MRETLPFTFHSLTLSLFLIRKMTIFETTKQARARGKKKIIPTMTNNQEISDLADQIGKGLTVQDKEEESVEIEKLAELIESGKVKKILVLTGAGVSVAAGIPDFRTPGTGLYSNLKKYNLPFPEAVFDVAFYRRNPKPFVTLAHELWPGLQHSPTKTHSFLSLLSKKGLLLRNYSQNIDGLEFLAGIPAEELVECHGHFRTGKLSLNFGNLNYLPSLLAFLPRNIFY